MFLEPERVFHVKHPTALCDASAVAAPFPVVSDAELHARLQALAPEPLSAAALEALTVHYRELARWNERLSLIGPGTVDRVLTRHFGEALTALPLIPEAPPGDAPYLDLGSGGGFPGLVIAAARPRWETLLVESRQRKSAFLSTVARKAGLPARPLTVRLESPLPAAVPEAIGLLTARGLRLDEPTWAALLQRLVPGAPALLWATEAPAELPAGWAARPGPRLPGSERRAVLTLARQGRG